MKISILNEFKMLIQAAIGNHAIIVAYSANSL